MPKPNRCSRALEIHEKALGPDHPDTATSMDQLAALLQSEGKLLEAERWARPALEIREKSPHPDPLTMAQGLNNLGGSCRVTGGGGEEAGPAARPIAPNPALRHLA